jgi:citrate synthase
MSAEVDGALSDRTVEKRGASQPAQDKSLTVTDNRTGKSYKVKISEENSIDATAFKQMKAPRTGRPEHEEEQGLRVYDPGYMNTAGSSDSHSLERISVVQ